MPDAWPVADVSRAPDGAGPERRLGAALRELVRPGADENLREMNKKLQNLLEEQLTKNLHLSQVGGAGGRAKRKGVGQRGLQGPSGAAHQDLQLSSLGGACVGGARVEGRGGVVLRCSPAASHLRWAHLVGGCVPQMPVFSVCAPRTPEFCACAHLCVRCLGSVGGGVRPCVSRMLEFHTRVCACPRRWSGLHHCWPQVMKV